MAGTPWSTSVCPPTQMPSSTTYAGTLRPLATSCAQSVTMHRLPATAAARARMQHGCVARRQLLASGVPARTLWDVAARHTWEQVHPGVWALPGTRDTYPRRVWAAVLAIDMPALVTGATALYMLQVLRHRPSYVALLLPLGRHRQALPGVELTRTSVFHDVGTSTVEGLRLVCAERALADHAVHLNTVALGRLMARACAQRLCTLASLHRELAARQRWPGRTAFRQALAMLVEELPHSGPERLARRQLRQAGIRGVHPRPYTVYADDKPLAEIDVALPLILYGLEIDGPHHDLPKQAAYDKQRDRALHRVWWTIDRFPVELVEEHPAQFVREVRAGIARAEAARTRRI